MPSNIVIDNGFATLKMFLEYDKQRRKKDRDELIQVVQQPPLTEEIFKRLIWLGPGDWDQVMRRHPGYAVEEVLSSLRHTLDVFSRSWRDLSFQLDRFSTFAASPDAMHRSKRGELEDIQSAVRKEVFALSAAALAAVAISQSLEKKVTVPGYRERIDATFVHDAQHLFIKKLRNTLNHGWFAAADWWMSHGPEGRSTAFTLSCADMLHNGDFTGAARNYIISAGERIDVRDLFSSYVAKVSDLYGWLWSVVDEHLDAATLEYRRCIRERKANAARAWWGLVLQGVENRKLDLYAYLDRYLTQEEVADVLKLPPWSKRQVDRIIALVDEHGACDDRLREKVYGLFGVVG